MLRLTLAAVSLALLALPVSAVTISACERFSDVGSIAEPWEANTRTFANGDIRLVVMDTIEPAATAFHLVILHPPRDELGSPMCSMVSADDGLGFGGMDIRPATASYDPTSGLTVSLPISVYDPEAASFYSEQWLTVTINQSTGALQAVAE